MNLKEVEELSIKILEDFSSEYKNPLTIIVFEAIKNVGLNKEKLIDFLKNKITESTLNEISNSSIIKKQVLKSFILLNEEEKDKIISNFVDYISKLEEKDGNIIVQNNELNLNKTKVFKTKNKNIVVKLLEDYKEFNEDNFDFCAKDDDLEIRIKTIPIVLNGINPKEEEQLKKYISDLKLSNNLKLLKKEDTKTVETQAINNNAYNMVLRNIDSILFENNEKIYVLSQVNYIGKNGSTDKYLAFVVQSFFKENYKKYEKIIELNLNGLLYESNEKEFLEVSTNNSVVSKIKLELGKDSAIVVEPKNILEKYNIEFQFGDVGHNLEDFKKMLSLYVKNFDETMNRIDSILNSMYEKIIVLLIDWEELDKEDLSFVKKCLGKIRIYVYDDGVKVFSSVYDKEKDESLLGGHFVETSFSLEELKNENLEWHLS